MGTCSGSSVFGLQTLSPDLEGDDHVPHGIIHINAPVEHADVEDVPAQDAFWRFLGNGDRPARGGCVFVGGISAFAQHGGHHMGGAAIFLDGVHVGLHLGKGANDGGGLLAEAGGVGTRENAKAEEKKGGGQKLHPASNLRPGCGKRESLKCARRRDTLGAMRLHLERLAFLPAMALAIFLSTCAAPPRGGTGLPGVRPALLPPNVHGRLVARTMRPRYITIHSTEKPGGTADQHARYLLNSGKRSKNNRASAARAG